MTANQVGWAQVALGETVAKETERHNRAVEANNERIADNNEKLTEITENFNNEKIRLEEKKIDLEDQRAQASLEEKQWYDTLISDVQQQLANNDAKFKQDTAVYQQDNLRLQTENKQLDLKMAEMKAGWETERANLEAKDREYNAYMQLVSDYWRNETSVAVAKINKGVLGYAYALGDTLFGDELSTKAFSDMVFSDQVIGPLYREHRVPIKTPDFSEMREIYKNNTEYLEQRRSNRSSSKYYFRGKPVEGAAYGY